MKKLIPALALLLATNLTLAAGIKKVHMETFAALAPTIGEYAGSREKEVKVFSAISEQCEKMQGINFESCLTVNYSLMAIIGTVLKEEGDYWLYDQVRERQSDYRLAYGEEIDFVQAARIKIKIIGAFRK